MPNKIRVALIGIGNCASSLVQGVEFYRGARQADRIPGVLHVNLGGYYIRDIEFTAGFDVTDTKVGTDLSDAIFAEPNNAYKICDVPRMGVPVFRGMVHHEGGGESGVPMADESTNDVASILKFTNTDVVVNCLPPSSARATEWYANQVLEAGCALVNCTPVPLAGSPKWSRNFERRALPLIGDDLKTQLGDTLTQRAVANLLRERGVRLERSFQVQYRGINREDGESGDSEVAASDERDRVARYMRLEGAAFGNVPVTCEFKMDSWDSPNSTGILIDAIRCAKLALDRGLTEPLRALSSYFMKAPPVPCADIQARTLVEAFIAGHAADVRCDKAPLELAEEARETAFAPENRGLQPNQSFVRPDEEHAGHFELIPKDT